MALREIGILTLAPTDDTPAFQAFRDRLRRNGWVEGRDFRLTFGFAADDGQLGSKADELLRIPNIELIVTGGTLALQAVNSRRIGPLSNVKIVQAVGGDQVPNDPNITGFHINALQTCKDQLDRLIRIWNPRTVTILVDHRNNPVLAPLTAHAGKRATINPLEASTSADLNNNKFNAVVGSFMMIPNGMFFNNFQTIVDLVDLKDIPKIYPEREYKKRHEGHGHANKVLVHGHKIPETYDRAADYVYNFLQNGRKDPPTVAPDGDVDADPVGPHLNVMEWFSQKTSIAGYQIPNWLLVLGVVIILFIIFH
jgi:hypothetical protein